jgi:hypothetical protein
MKLLKASFLLAAAATATQLDANEYLAVWNLTNGNTAKATIGVNPAQFNTSAYNIGDGSSSWVTKLDMVITNSSNIVLFSSTKADVNYFRWNPSGHDLTTTENNVSYSYGTFMIFSYSGAFYVDAMFGGFWSNSYGSRTAGGAATFIDSFGPAFSGVTDVVAWMSSIDNQNRIYTNGATLAGLPLEGAHHRPMLSFDRMGKASQAWATGDFGSSSRTRDVHVTSGEAGINWNVGKSFLFGVAGGHAVQNQDLAFNGSSATKGDFVLAELDYRPEGTQWIVSLLGMVGSWESKTNRGYLDGASLDSSFGVADTITRSARFRVDAPAVATFGGFGFAPYASYTVTQTVVAAHTETGGAFPATFDEQSHNATEARLGVTASKDLSAETKLLLSVEGIHRFDGVGPALTGQDVTGGVSFSLPGVAPRADCVRFGFDVDHKLSADTLLNVSAHVSTVGEAHDVSAAISIRRAF